MPFPIAPNSLIAYWLSSEITNTFPCPPAAGVGSYVLPNGAPQIASLNLMNCVMQAGANNTVTLKLDASTQATLEAGIVATLHAAKINVLVTVNNNSGANLGWGNLNSTQAASLASAAAALVQQYGLDGIDIDDENVPGTPQTFYSTVQALRNALPAGALISHAIYDQQDYNKFNQTTVIDLLDYCCTMVYGDDAGWIESNVNWFHNAGQGGSGGKGIPYAKLCAGVQPGPAGGNQMTSIATANSVADWATQTGLLGVMLYSYSQDVAAFTQIPQHGTYPGPLDHLWQANIVATLQGLTLATTQSTQPWQSTGITVAAGQTVTLVYGQGLWTSNPNDNNGALFTAAGNPSYVAVQPGYTMVGQFEGALIGQVGGNPVFLVGNGPTSTPAGQTGLLQLCINDDLQGLYGAGLKDNIGQMSMLIAVS